MEADNDAGAVSTYVQAGAQYSTRLLWIMFLLLPITYFVQEMVVRLGIATGILLSYCLAVQAVKIWFLNKFGTWIWGGSFLKWSAWGSSRRERGPCLRWAE